MKFDRVPRSFGFLLFSLSSAVLSVFLSKVAVAEEMISVDENCRPLPESGGRPPSFSIFYSREFMAGESPYWLHAGRYTDGAVLFCISSAADFSNAAPIPLSEIKNQFIETIEQKSDGSPIFQVRVAEGNGMDVPFVDYQLNLTVPSRPAIAILNEGCCLNPR